MPHSRLPKISLQSTPYRSSKRCIINGQSHQTSTLDRRRTISTYGYTQAKCLVYAKHGKPSEVLSLHTHSIGPPHSSLVTLRTLSAPLNPADINQIQGTYPTVPPFTSTLGTSEPTAVAGNEGCFEVLATGSGVKSVEKGDWVIAKHTGLGTWRTHLQVEEDKVMRVEKEGLRSEQVGTVAVNPVTAYRMLKDFVKLDEGDWWIQNGANSGVGRAALQLGKRWGYKSIAVFRTRPGEAGERLKTALKELGATKVVTYGEMGNIRELKDKVKEWTNGNPSALKLAFNCVGGTNPLTMTKILSPGACMVTYGAMSTQPITIGASTLIFKDLRFSGFWVSRWSDAHPEEKKRTVYELLDMMRKGEFQDAPIAEVKWDWGTTKEELVDAVQRTLDGYRSGKGMFMFGDM